MKYKSLHVGEMEIKFKQMWNCDLHKYTFGQYKYQYLNIWTNNLDEPKQFIHLALGVRYLAVLLT